MLKDENVTNVFKYSDHHENGWISVEMSSPKEKRKYQRLNEVQLRSLRKSWNMNESFNKGHVLRAVVYLRRSLFG